MLAAGANGCAIEISFTAGLRGEQAVTQIIAPAAMANLWKYFTVCLSRICAAMNMFARRAHVQCRFV
jgi:hypothetical protein